MIDATGKTSCLNVGHARTSVRRRRVDVASGVTTRDLETNDPIGSTTRNATTTARRSDRTCFDPASSKVAVKSCRPKITAETEEEAKKAVDFYAGRGYEGIKIYNSMKVELVPVLAKLAHEKGMRVSGHIPVHMRAEEAVRAGYDEIQHINMLFLNFFIDKDTDTRTTLRFSIVAEKGAGLDLQSKPVKDFALLLEKKTVVDPTVNAFDLILGRPGKILPGLEPWSPPSGCSPNARRSAACSARRKRRTYQQSKKVCDGEGAVRREDTDRPGHRQHRGLALHHELALYARGSRTATSSASRPRSSKGMKVEKDRLIAAGKQRTSSSWKAIRRSRSRKGPNNGVRRRALQSARFYPTVGVR